ncbi:50S ribosomal protein L18e [Methanohalophilus mahii]|uniref:Large ribosomal subunit protein eL18 n=1 Tax=Methanohalophilus mahii (strain ATCC 35705 / DSM 5219 / SLP) TaxID=547558 RepID=D5E7A0_METMS|nr:50S ribosomal protein L18e [Methanohalophilus mahii]ADE37038.1 LSU ribosomal protein L18AE [Methanohalophilus mahii DSM 5219]
MSKKTQNKIERKSDPRVPSLIVSLKEQARQEDAAIWRDIARRLEKPRKNYAEVNLSKLNRNATDDEIVLVPGKVLGAGILKRSVAVAALGFSASAKEKIAENGGRCITIEEIMKEKPAGSGIRILI